MARPEPHGEPVEPSQPSFRAATALAREAAFAAMRKAGRLGLNDADRAIGNALLARLFWHVEGAEGGFVGLSDEALQERVAHYRLDLSQVRDAAWAPGAWPVAAIVRERIAA